MREERACNRLLSNLRENYLVSVDVERLRCPWKILAVTAFFKQFVECQQGTQIASFAECNDSFFLGVLIFIVHCKWKNISHGKPVQAAYTARKEDGPVANVRIIGAELEQGGKSIEED